MGVKLDIYEYGEEVIVRYLSEFEHEDIADVALQNLRNELEDKLEDNSGIFYVYSTGMDVRVEIDGGKKEDLEGVVGFLNGMYDEITIKLEEAMEVQYDYLNTTMGDWSSLLE